MRGPERGRLRSGGPARRTAVLAVAAAVLLAGCVTSGGQVAQTPVVTLSPPTPSPTPSANLPNAELVYVGGPGARAIDDPGYKAAQMVVAQANAGQFGTLPVSVELVPLNMSQGSLDLLSSLSALIGNPEVVGFIGPASSSEALALGPILHAAGIPFVTFATQPALGTMGWDRFFRAVVDDNAVSAAAAHYVAQSIEPNCTYLVTDGTGYGDNLAAGFDNAMDAIGGRTKPTAPRVLGADPSDRRLATVARAVGASGCRAVFFGGSGRVGGELVSALAGRPATAGDRLIGADEMLNDAFGRSAGPAGDGTIAACACAHLQSADGPAAAAFLSTYRELWHTSPGRFAAEAWDVAEMYVAAFKANKTARGTIAGFLHTLSGFPGLTKVYSYQSTGGGNLAPPTAVFMYRFVKGEWRYLGPAYPPVAASPTPAPSPTPAASAS